MRVLNHELLANQKIYQIDLMGGLELQEANAWTDFTTQQRLLCCFFDFELNKLPKQIGVYNGNFK